MVGKQVEIRKGNPPNTSQLCVLQTAWYFHKNSNRIIIIIIIITVNSLILNPMSLETN